MALLADRRLIRLGLISSVSFGFSVILGNWAVTLLERTGGLTRSSAGAIGSLILIVGIAGRPAGGVLVRARPERTRALLAASFLAGAVGTVLLALSAGRGLDAAAAALIGLAAGIPFGVTMAGSTRAYPEAGGAAIGAMNTYPVLAVVCGTPLAGLTFSLPGDGRVGFAVVAALWAAATATLPGLMEGMVDMSRYPRKIDHTRDVDA
jgi:fucose permease